MENTVVVGAQWGDEGKAKITDLLAQDADIVIRYQGGCNAGHTVVHNGETYKFHLIPSGILYGEKICFIGSGTVIHPDTFKAECEELCARGVDLSGLKISPLASVTMPYHIETDGRSEVLADENKIGTTKKGIGPTYTDKIARTGLKIQDLYCPETLSARLDAILPLKNKMLTEIYGLRPYSKEEITCLCLEYADIFRPYVCFDWQALFKTFKDKTVLFEGAQGVMLDVDFGTYPYVTSSNPIAGGAFTGSGLGTASVQEIIGVSKAYITRVGEGPFVTEIADEMGSRIREVGNEFGTTTGRARRCGWFDSVIARYAVLVSGLTSMAVTKLDVFDEFEEIKICTAYKDSRDGTVYTDYPTNAFIHKYLEPIYEIHQGWMEDISTHRMFEELPDKAVSYIKRLEELCEVPVSIVSVGPNREQVIYRKNK